MPIAQPQLTSGKRRKLAFSPDPRLKQASAKVADVDDSIRELLDDMAHTMRINDGIGLAAVQIGVMKCAIVVDKEILNRPGSSLTGMNKDAAAFSLPILYMVNTEILEFSQEKETAEEGCLSYPGVYVPIMRSTAIKAKFLDYYGQEHTIETTGLMARCIQHEVDHSNGIVIVDYLPSALKREFALKKIEKFLKLRPSLREGE